MIKKIIQYIFFISILSVTVFSCTKEISDDIFNFIESFFSLEVVSDTNEVEIGEAVNFTLTLQESDLPSEYILDFSSNGEGEFTLDSTSFTSGQSTNIERGTRNITYLPTSNGIHFVKFTVTNANEEPLSLSETISITVGEPVELEPSFNIIVETDLENVNEEGVATVTEGATVTITIRIVNELDNVPDGTEYAIEFGSSATGTFVFEGENYTGDSRVVVAEKELVFEFTPEEIEEYDLKFSVTSQFDDSSICESVIFDVLISDSEKPVITLNGENPLILTVGDEYVEEATVVDDIDNAIEITFGGTFDGTTNTVGEFTRTYNAVDSDGNVAEQKERIINIVTQDVVLIDSIALTPAILNLGLNTTQELNVIINPENATNKELEWTSDDTSIATVANGIITTVGLGGPINITARATDGSNISTVVELIVISDIMLANEITIVNFSEIMEVGESDTFTVSVIPAEASQTVMWTSTNPNVASVNENTGLVTALTAGETMITAETTDGSNLEVSTNVTVEIAITGISVAPSEVTLIVGGIADLEASVQPPNVTNPVVTWTSNNPEIVEVDSNGRIAGVSVGNTVVRATIGGFSSIVSVIVSASNSSPTANISFAPASGGVTGTEYTFDGSGSSDPQGDSLTYTWLIDGSEITGEEVVYTFTNAGTFIIELTVGDGELESTIEETITITEALSGENDITAITIDGVITPSAVIDFENHTASLQLTSETNDVTSSSQIGFIVSDGAVLELIGGTSTEAALLTAGYNVIAENGDVKSWGVSVLRPSRENDIIGFTLSDQGIDATIDTENHIATIQLDSGTAPEAFSELGVQISEDASLQFITSLGFVANQRTYIYRVTAAIGEEQQWSVVVLDAVNIAPVASVILSATEGDAPLTVQLDGSGSTDADGDPLSYLYSNGQIWTAANSPTTAITEFTLSIPGTYFIEFEVSDNRGGSDTEIVTITVTEPVIPVTSISATPATITVEIGVTRSFSTTIVPMNADNQGLSFESDNTSVATVSASTTNSLNGFIRGVSLGSTTVTVASDDNGLEDTIEVIVVEPRFSEDTGVLIADPGTTVMVNIIYGDVGGEGNGTITAVNNGVELGSATAIWTSDSGMEEVVEDSFTFIMPTEGRVNIVGRQFVDDGDFGFTDITIRIDGSTVASFSMIDETRFPE